MRFVSVKATVGVFGMLRRVDSIWIIFRTSVRACTTDRYRAGERVRFNKTRWILLTRTYVVERFWAEFEIRPQGAILTPLPLPPLPSVFFLPSCYFSRSVLRSFSRSACCRWKVRDSFDSWRNGAIMHGVLFPVNRKTRILATFRYIVKWNESHRIAANEVGIIYNYDMLNIGLSSVFPQARLHLCTENI